MCLGIHQFSPKTIFCQCDKILLNTIDNGYEADGQHIIQFRLFYCLTVAYFLFFLFHSSPSPCFLCCDMCMLYLSLDMHMLHSGNCLGTKGRKSDESPLSQSCGVQNRTMN